MDFQKMPTCCKECIYSEDINEDPLNSAKYICKVGYKMKKETCKRQRHPTKHAPDARESGAKSIIQIKKVCKARARVMQSVRRNEAK